MASMRLGSKADVFHLDGHTWYCSTELPSDVIIEVGDTSFHLHKFPLLSRSAFLANLIAESPKHKEQKSTFHLDAFPGGAQIFLLVAKFCYNVKIELTRSNVVRLRCAAEYLQMTEDFGEANLIWQTETFLKEIFTSWSETLKVLGTCEEVLQQAEQLHIVSRCITSLSIKACLDPRSCTNPLPGNNCCKQSPVGMLCWNGISTVAKPQPISEDWWYEDVSHLRLAMYKRLIHDIGTRGMKLELVSGSIMHYANKNLPLTGRQLSLHSGSQVTPAKTGFASSTTDQRSLLEEIVGLLPQQKYITPTKFLLRLLRTAMILQASQVCREHLEKQIGEQLDQASLEDLLIPNMGNSAETLYDVDCVQRMLEHFMLVDTDAIYPCPDSTDDGGQLMRNGQSLNQLMMVASLVDSYLVEVAPDVNLKPTKFQSLADAIPDYARPLDDGIYRAIDIYFKGHPWLTEVEREQMCRLMNCQKLSLEASTHAAQNERLPVRVLVQVVFFEQLRLRTSIAGWFHVSDSIENTQNPSNSLAIVANNNPAQGNTTLSCAVVTEDMRDRVSELENECLCMKQELAEVVQAKATWKVFFRRFGCSLKSKVARADVMKLSKRNNAAAQVSPLENEKENGNLTDVEDQPVLGEI